MGTIIAPTYATLVMGYLEIQFYEKCKKYIKERLLPPQTMQKQYPFYTS